MPKVAILSTTAQLADIDSKRLLEAVIDVMLQEINALRQQAGLTQITASQARSAIIQAYKNA